MKETYKTDPAKNIEDYWGLVSALVIGFIVAVIIGCAMHPEPAPLPEVNSYPSALPARPIPPDLAICRDTNGPIDWRTNK